MDIKYYQYLYSDFAQDIDFINWVKKGTNQNEWEKFILENPQLKDEIEKARKIVVSFNISETKPSNHEYGIYELWRSIDLFHNQKYKPQPTIRRLKWYHYAAVLTIVVFSSGLLSYFFSKNEYIEVTAPTYGISETKLILPSGREVILNDKFSEIQVNQKGSQITVNNDSIVKYQKLAEEKKLTHVVVPFGRRLNVVLSDGTKVWLNGGSKFIFPQKFFGKERRVYLKGEGYFDVAENKQCPFIVSGEKLDATVLGTKFDFKNFDADNEIEVILVEGKVSLKEKGVFSVRHRETFLTPNQKATFNKTSNNLNVQSGIDVSNYVSWKDGYLIFRKEKIDVVFAKIARFYNVKIRAEEEVLLHNNISGKLDLKDSLSEVLSVVAETTPISFKIINNQVFIKQKLKYLPMQ